MKECTHLAYIKEVTPASEGCADCIAQGDTWVHLRMCRTCGYVGCCDDSKNKHARGHFHDTGHPLVRSFEPGEDWGHCYVDGIYMTLGGETLEASEDADKPLDPDEDADSSTM